LLGNTLRYFSALMFASRWRWDALFAQGSGLALDLTDDRDFLGVM